MIPSASATIKVMARDLHLSLWKPLALLVLCVGPAAEATELERYLIAPTERPARCEQITELLPVNEKVAAFYEGKAYASVIPAPVDRHTQSFQCEGTKGTLYFFQYLTTRDKDQALLFARPVVTQGTDSPRLLDWSGGFVILSFANAPDDLKTLLEAKVAPPPLFTEVGVSTFIVTSLPEIPTLSTNSTNSTNLTNIAISTIPALSTATPPSVSSMTATTPPPHPSSAKPIILNTPSDISVETLKRIRKALACRDKDLPKELVPPCEWFEAFRKAVAVTPVVISTGARIGQGYRLYEDGSLGGEVFQAAVGSGEIGEINLFPLYPANGAEELELRAIVTSTDGKPTPKLSGDFMQRLENFTRPTGRTFMRTSGESWLAHRPNQAIYLRAAGELWILLTVEKPRDESPEPQSFTISAFK